MDSFKKQAKNNPIWFDSLTSKEQEQCLSGEMDKIMEEQWAEDDKRDKEVAESGSDIFILKKD